MFLAVLATVTKGEGTPSSTSNSHTGVVFGIKFLSSIRSKLILDIDRQIYKISRLSVRLIS